MNGKCETPLQVSAKASVVIDILQDEIVREIHVYMIVIEIVDVLPSRLLISPTSMLDRLM